MSEQGWYPGSRGPRVPAPRAYLNNKAGGTRGEALVGGTEIEITEAPALQITERIFPRKRVVSSTGLPG